MASTLFDPTTTALVLIDLQAGILGRTLAPHSAADVVTKSAQVAAAVRAAGGLVVYVRVDLADIKRLPADAPGQDPNAPIPPPAASELAAGCGVLAGDPVVTKRSWGAFYGTDLELRLRRHGVKTILLGGIATNFGVESTARAAYDRGYEIIFIEDAMSSVAAAAHEFAVQTIFKRMGRVRSSAEVLAEL